ncbi:MAG TPA: CYCXC family (seleno)protein [Candidatus Binataceae bacterium]|nr:CYCXC family (seleno)protein [Candidatus Binataceae bacterium]
MGTKGTLLVIAAVILMAAGAYVWFGVGGPADATSSASSAGDAGETLRATLDPNMFKGDVREAYEVARKDPALLAQLHCYCGCDKTEGHRSLLDCYRDKHGSTCAICVGEAREAEQLARQGMPVEQIRDSLRARYGGGE